MAKAPPGDKAQRPARSAGYRVLANFFTACRCGNRQDPRKLLRVCHHQDNWIAAVVLCLGSRPASNLRSVGSRAANGTQTSALTAGTRHSAAYPLQARLSAPMRSGGATCGGGDKSQDVTIANNDVFVSPVRLTHGSPRALLVGIRVIQSSLMGCRIPTILLRSRCPVALMHGSRSAMPSERSDH